MTEGERQTLMAVGRAMMCTLLALQSTQRWDEATSKLYTDLVQEIASGVDKMKMEAQI